MPPVFNTLNGSFWLVGLNYHDPLHNLVPANQPAHWVRDPLHFHHFSAMPVRVTDPATGQLAHFAYVRWTAADVLGMLADVNMPLFIALTPTGPQELPGFGQYRHLYSGVMPCDFEVTIDQKAFELLSPANQMFLNQLLMHADIMFINLTTTPALAVNGAVILPHFFDVHNYFTT